MNRVRTALVGCGKVGQIHARALARWPNRNLWRPATSTCNVPLHLGAAFGVKPYHDVAAMLAEARRPGRLHRHAASAARRAGGPRGRGGRARAGRETAGRQPRRLRSHARGGAASGTKLGVISQRRWYEPVLRMRAAIDAGKIGRPVLGVFMMYSWRDPAYYQSDPWRGRWDTEGGGVLVNQSPHMIDLLQWLMDDAVAEVSGYWANLNHPVGRSRRHRRRDPAVPAAAGWARSSRAWRRSREFTPRCTFMDRMVHPSASRPIAGRRSSPA